MMFWCSENNVVPWFSLGLIGGGGGDCGMFYRLNVIKIFATNEVGMWA
jgi:hypothetical protein